MQKLPLLNGEGPFPDATRCLRAWGSFAGRAGVIATQARVTLILLLALPNRRSGWSGDFDGARVDPAHGAQVGLPSHGRRRLQLLVVEGISAVILRP